MTTPDWHWHDDELISYCYCGTAPDLSPAEAQIVERFEAAPYPAELLFVCHSYSHGADGWHCAVEGPHDEHRNAAGDVTWVVEP